MEKFYLLAAVACIVTGAYAIHWGLALMVCGVGILIGSYVEYCKNKEEEYSMATTLTLMKAAAVVFIYLILTLKTKKL